MARSTEGKLAPIILNAGMNQSAGIHGGIAGSLEYAINCRIKAAGRLQRRCGTTGVDANTWGPTGRAYADSATTPRATERPMFAASYQGEAHVASTAGDVYRYDGNLFEFFGCCSSVKPFGRSCVLALGDMTASADATMPAVAVSSTGYKLVATTSADSPYHIQCALIGPDGTIQYRGTTTAGSAPYPRVRAIAQGARLLLLYQSGSNIESFSWNTTASATAPQIGPVAGTIRALNSATAHWDATSYDSNNWYLVARTGATTCTVQAVDNQTAGGSGTFSTTGEVELSIWGDTTNGRLWVGYLDDPSGTPTAGFITLDTAFATVFSKTTILSSATGVPLFGARYSRAGANSDTFFVLQQTVGVVPAMRFGHVVAGVVTPATPRVTHWAQPVSKPDTQQRWWSVVRTEADAPLQFVLVRYSEAPNSGHAPLTIEAAAPLSANEFDSYTPGFHAVAVESEAAGARTFVALPQMLSTATATSDRVDSVAVYLYEYARYNQEPTLGVDVSSECIAAGQPASFSGIGSTVGSGTWNGSRVVELGFPQQPIITAVVATPDANGLAAGSYQYQAVFQWADQFGRRHLSAPSLVWDLDLTVASSVALTVSDCQLGQRTVGLEALRPTVLLYRTVDGGEVPQLLPLAEPSASAAGTVSFADSVADAVVSQNEFLYTGGGVLPNRLAPSCRYVRTAEDRVWVGGLWDESIIEASKVLIPSEPPNFTLDPSHQVVLPGACTGLAYQDGQIVAFTEDEICLVSGDGPNDQGAGSFLAPQSLVRGLGCAREESASILETEHGIIFRSKSSWWLIPRGFGQPQDIGAAVQDESQHCIAAALTETSEYRLARFLIAGAGVYSSDTVLTLDLTNMQWFRDVYTGAAFGTIGPWPDGLALCQYSLDRSGSAVANVIWYEDETVETDAAASPVYIPYSFRTNWQYPFGPSGWGKVNRVQLAMEPLDSATRSVAMTVETDAASYAPTAWSVAGTVAGGLQYREAIPPNGQSRCTAFRVTVALTQDAGPTTLGFRLLSLTAELGPDGPEAGLRQLLSTERA
jgi:hypothetical protein